jgi:hypothetical protein
MSNLEPPYLKQLTLGFVRCFLQKQIWGTYKNGCCLQRTKTARHHTQTELLLMCLSRVSVDVWRRDKALPLSGNERRVYLALPVRRPFTPATVYIRRVNNLTFRGPYIRVSQRDDYFSNLFYFT